MSQPDILTGWRAAAVVIAVTVAIVGALFLGWRDLAYFASPQGRCMIGVQPSILIGMAPSFTTQLDCA